MGARQAAGVGAAGSPAPDGEGGRPAELATLDWLDEMHCALYAQLLSNGAAYSTHRFGGAGPHAPSGFMLRAAGRAGATVVRTSAAAVEAFRAQEAQRYAQPERPFRFEFTARDSSGAERTFATAVAPIRRGGAGGGAKPREHALLRSERPAHATILTLVRDAAARLPDGVGTRADVSELLRDSAYVVDGAQEGQLSQVVSGALDRLHYEKDACVKYEPERKLWIYLHRHRQLHEFGAAARQGAPRGAPRPRAHRPDARTGPRGARPATRAGEAQAGSLRKKPAAPGPAAPPAPGAGPRAPVQLLPPGAAPPPGALAAGAGPVRPPAAPLKKMG